MFDSIFKNRNLLTLILSFFIFLFIYWLSGSGAMYILNKKVEHTFYGLKNANIHVNDDILVVEIDDNTLKIDSESNGVLGRFPFDRKNYIPVIENLNKAGAKVIAFDIIFSENTSSDQDLKETIKKAGNVLIGGFVSKKKTEDGSAVITEFNQTIFKDVIETTGFFEPIINSFNNVVYSIQPFQKMSNGSIYEHFSLAILRSYYSYIYGKDFLTDSGKIDNDFYTLIPDRKIPLARQGTNELLINFIDYEQFKNEKKVVSFIDVFDEQRFNKIKEFVDFEGKIILIGATASGLKDIFNTPNGTDFGVYTHANMINTIMSKSYLSYFDEHIEWLIIFLLIVISVYFNFSRSGYVLIASNIAIIGIFVVIYPFLVLFFTQLIMNHTVELLFTLMISLTLSNLIKYFIENKHKTKLNKALGEYVSKDIAAEILSGAGKVNLNGENKKVSIFFSDIEGFTSISEHFSPDILVKFLREYLGAMSDIIMDEKGFINKYEGDAIMALWGVFGEVSKQNSFDACRAALKQQETLKKLNITWTQQGFSQIKARMGIHTGNAIIGNIGSEGRKMEFTALGDHVNLASRLEGVNKYYGTYICVSQDIYQEVKNNFEFRYLDKIKVKGKNKPIAIYELLANKGELSQEQISMYNQFKEALTLYLQKDFIGAKEIFQQLEQLGDMPSKTYISRCDTFIETIPGDDWDGVWTMENK